MDIKEMRIDEIVPYENNPRINENSIDLVANSIKEFGFKVPIVIDKNNVIVAGHTRFKASKNLGLKKVPCVIADDLTEEQVRAFRLADNKTAEFSTWDFEKLEMELETLTDINMKDFGFTSEIVEEVQETQEDDFSEDEVKESRVKLGDIWKLGNHRLICGDSTDVLTIDRLMGGGEG